MAITGKKINELTDSTELSAESVLPIVIVNAGTPEATATKVTLAQLAEYLGGGGGGGGSIPVPYEYNSDSWTLSADCKTLTILDTSEANAIWVFKNGVKQRQNSSSSTKDKDYWLSGTALIFNVALDPTDVITLEVF